MDKQISESLLKRMERDDPDALNEYALLVSATDPDAARKYTLLAAQLGNPSANERVGDMYFAAGDVNTARSYYKTGVKAGLLECSVKLAVIELRGDNEHSAVHELEELAEIGISSAAKALADYYREKGNKRQSAYWNSLVK